MWDKGEKNSTEKIQEALEWNNSIVGVQLNLSFFVVAH